MTSEKINPFAEPGLGIPADILALRREHSQLESMIREDQQAHEEDRKRHEAAVLARIRDVLPEDRAWVEVLRVAHPEGHPEDDPAYRVKLWARMERQNHRSLDQIEFGRMAYIRTEVELSVFVAGFRALLDLFRPLRADEDQEGEERDRNA